MDDTSPFRKKWLYIILWLVILLVLYGWQIVRMGGIQASVVDIFIDLACVFPLFLVLWMAFFAQFVLPVRTFRDRQKIFDRLITYLFGGHGPALFIESGVVKEHSGERLKKGPGVVWLDTASAAVTRTAVAVKNVIGPGVHFTENNEYIAGSLDLHNQLQTLGPAEEEDPFMPKPDENIDSTQYENQKNKYERAQTNRMKVSALTRDGIEVVPNISVIFRVDTKPPEDGHPGSLFGYRTGDSKKDMENKQKDDNAIEKAIIVGEGINPYFPPDSYSHRVPWNQLPGLLAADIWREYLAKFTLDQLFEIVQEISFSPDSQQQPTEEEVEQLSQPIQMTAKRGRLQETLAEMLSELTKFTNIAIGWLEGKKEATTKKTAPKAFAQPLTPSPSGKIKKKTGIQVINDMVKARLMQPDVEMLDKNVQLEKDTISSKEYSLLQNRGLIVINANISNLRFKSPVEEQFVSQWKATWLSNAKAERDQIDRQRSYIETSGQEQAIRQYAESLSRELVNKKPTGIKETLKTLVMRSRFEIINRDQLRQGMSTELEDIEDIIKWVELNGS